MERRALIVAGQGCGNVGNGSDNESSLSWQWACGDFKVRNHSPMYRTLCGTSLKHGSCDSVPLLDPGTICRHLWFQRSGGVQVSRVLRHGSLLEEPLGEHCSHSNLNLGM
jgi:hypothetical protein